MKQRKIRIAAAVMCIGLVSAGMTAAAAETELSAEMELLTEVSAENEEGLSNSLYDFQVKIGDEIYQFPMYYEDFTAQGWTIGKNDDPEMGVGTNSYCSVSFYKGNDRVSVSVLNLGINELPIKECLIAGINVNAQYDFDAEKTPVELPCGIVVGTSTADDIITAYGDPSDTYEGEMYTSYSYEKDIYEEITFYVYKESNALQEVDMRNFAEPEGYDKGSVSEEVPEIVTNYTAPTELGTEMLDPRVEFCGDLYTLPAPVSAFLENGWELVDVEEGAYAAGRDLEFVDMMKNNQTIHVGVYNFTKNATAIENCFVRDLDLGSYDSEALTFCLSGGFTIGAKKADLIAAAEASGYAYEENGDYLNIYLNADTKYDNRAQFGFYDDEDPETATSVEYINEILPE